MCEPTLWVAAIGAIGSYAQYQGAQDQADAQDRASSQAAQQATATAAANKKQAEETAAANQTQAEATAGANKEAADKAAYNADIASNLANAKRPDIGGLSARNALDSKGGQSGTMLTGPKGVNPKDLLLGRTTLLGQ